MTLTNIILVVVSLALLVVLLRPKLLQLRLWRATVTPLASIIGSGFLVVGPILDHAAGSLAWLAMIILCAVAYLFGMAIRYNIMHLEPELKDSPLPLVAGIKRLSELALSFAYFVSVAYYLNLFAAFGLRIDGITDPFWIRVAATVAIGSIGLLGALGGLSGLERLEVGAVGLKLSLIGGLFVALIVASLIAVGAGDFQWAVSPGLGDTKDFQILLGLVILVQGFETSRYLGGKYSAEMRVRTMRLAQWISTGIYIVFILLITAYFQGGLRAVGGETAIIDMLRPLGTMVAPLIILTALASQLSAAVADMNGAAGLIAETTRRRVRVHMGNAITAVLAIVITWSADIYAIITYASKFFVAYYALQCLQAAYGAWRHKRHDHAVLYAAGIFVALGVVFFAIPANAAG
ncbi:MAG: hypothetical protein GC184_08030 [Rhizobiales bacterium]|nr:hypothetical protein [Hyphomicrobiales bacterium]